MKATAFLFLATLFCITWEKVHWSFGVDVSISDVLTILFLLAFALEWVRRGERRLPRTTAIVLIVFAALLVVYLVGFFNIQTKDSLDQWLKGMVKFVLHFLFLAAAVAYMARRSSARPEHAGSRTCATRLPRTRTDASSMPRSERRRR